jgi:glycosyltransferase involved in cell wall biosynthesis
MELTLVIPTRDRGAVLLEAMARLGEQQGGVAFEAIVVDDGSTDGTPAALDRAAPEWPFDLTVIRRRGGGPAAARNRAIEVARAPVCLFLNDDSWPQPDLLARHRDFHVRRPEPEAALLGRIELPAVPPATPFMRWLATALFDYGGIEDPRDAGGARFFTANVSAKTELLRGAGGFDERFRSAAHEDIDLGLRLERLGMRLAYDPDAVVEHSHPMDLPAAIERLRGVGAALAQFTDRHSDWPVPRRPGLRHRVKASALTALTALGARDPRLKRETWRFLCHEAGREGYWGAVDGEDGPLGAPGLRVGATLARLASRDPDARMPAADGATRAT